MEQYKPPTTRVVFQSDKRYHVFLSFRGPDVIKTLVDHFYEALTQAGLNVFLDSDKLVKGEMIGVSIERAIESSVVRIPIFSNGYADSVWYLREAAAMSRTPGLIIPLFYHVDPTNVRFPERVSSPYYRSFLKHLGRHPKEEITEWKRALHQICSYSGWSMEMTQGYEAQLIKRVVSDLIKTLDKMSVEMKNDGEQNEGEEKEEEAQIDEKGHGEQNVGEEKEEEAQIDEKEHGEQNIGKEKEEEAQIDKIEHGEQNVGKEKEEETYIDEKGYGEKSEDGEEEGKHCEEDEEEKNGEEKGKHCKEDEGKNGKDIEEEEEEEDNSEIVLLKTMERYKNEFHNPGCYVIEYVHPPQMFSDENPNACSIM